MNFLNTISWSPELVIGMLALLSIFGYTIFCLWPKPRNTETFTAYYGDQEEEEVEEEEEFEEEEEVEDDQEEEELNPLSGPGLEARLRQLEFKASLATDLSRQVSKSAAGKNDIIGVRTDIMNLAVELAKMNTAINADRDRNTEAIDSLNRMIGKLNTTLGTSNEPQSIPATPNTVPGGFYVTMPGNDYQAWGTPVDANLVARIKECEAARNEQVRQLQPQPQLMSKAEQVTHLHEQLRKQLMQISQKMTDAELAG